MSIFGKKVEKKLQISMPPSPKPSQDHRQHSQLAPVVDATSRRSYLSAGCELQGDLTGEGSFECSGSFDGEIDISGDVVIGHGGTAKAQLKGRRISIDGRLHGNAIGGEKVQVGASGHVEGNLRAPAVQFVEGAFFEGNVEMRRPEGVDLEAGSTGDDEVATDLSEDGGTNDVVSGDSR